MSVVKIKVILNFHVSLFHAVKKLKRTDYKAENASFSSFVSLSSTHHMLVLLQNDNFILKSHVTFTKSFSNWLYAGKIPKRLDAVLSGNKFNENFCGLAMLKQTNYNHSVKRKLEGIYFSLQLYFSFNYGISFIDLTISTKNESTLLHQAAPPNPR